MADIIRDTFTAADGTLLVNHTGELGAAWTMLYGDALDCFVIRDGTARRPTFAENPTSASYSFAAVASSGLLPEGSYTITFSLIAGTTGNNYQIEIGACDLDIGYFMESFVTISAFSGANNVYVHGDYGGETGNLSLVGGTEYLINIEVTASTTTVKANGIEVASGPINPYAYGRLAFGIFDNSNSLAAINHITVSVPTIPDFWTGFVNTVETH